MNMGQSSKGRQDRAKGKDATGEEAQRRIWKVAMATAVQGGLERAGLGGGELVVGSVDGHWRSPIDTENGGEADGMQKGTATKVAWPTMANDGMRRSA
ncbi:hypothetical protein Pint_07823 [Pistacia integerrima]|uniref:Uncharacterized protein n=1 Tax=Pistacia integerrima TaxID=434235 RepID=A0ACC0XRP3_9ROSI|nr:hypothetical protein Pint_07823 [Pistacia integerrima]